MRITFKRVLLAGGIACCLFVAWMAYQLLGAGAPITVSPQTTVLTEPLADDGLPDYSLWMLGQMRKGVTPENNGAIPFLQAMWPADLNGEQQMAVCAELGIDLPESDGMREPYNSDTIDAVVEWIDVPAGFATEDDAIRAFASELTGYAGGTPWRGDQLPPIKNWLDANNANIDLLLEAAARPQVLPASSRPAAKSRRFLRRDAAPAYSSQSQCLALLAHPRVLSLGRRRSAVGVARLPGGLRARRQVYEPFSRWRAGVHRRRRYSQPLRVAYPGATTNSRPNSPAKCTNSSAPAGRGAAWRASLIAKNV